VFPFESNRTLQFFNSEDTHFNLGNFNFFLSPKIIEDGSFTDFGIGMLYTNNLEGELHTRITAISKNEELSGVTDSLNAIKEYIFELFFIPVKYNFLKTDRIRLCAGSGLYYKYDKLNEKGYFNLPELETLTPPKERVNSYTNEFSMHLVGPVADTEIYFSSKQFNISFSAGIVPVFFLNSSQNMSITPLLYPNNAEYSQNAYGSPYFFMRLDSVIFKYLNIVLLYDYMKLNYKVIDFDDNLNWINPEKIFITQSFKIEASILIPWDRNMYTQVGYGYAFDLIKTGSAVAVNGNRQYIILAAKKSSQ
jgi:hypothetical protein